MITHQASVYFTPFFGPLPDLPATIVRSFASPWDAQPVSRGDRLAQAEAMNLFVAPELRSFPVDTFLGRLICEFSSREDIHNNAELVRAVWKRAEAIIRQGKWILNEDDWESMKSSPQRSLIDYSYNQLNALGDFIIEKEDDLLSRAFWSLFIEPVLPMEALEDVGLVEASIPEDVTMGAYIRHWISRPLPRPLAQPLRFSVAGRVCEFRERCELQSFLIGWALRRALSSNKDAEVILILRYAAQIYPGLLGPVFSKMIEKQNDNILDCLFRRRTVEWEAYVDTGLYTAIRLNNAKACNFIKKAFQKDWKKLVRKAWATAVEERDPQMKWAILPLGIEANDPFLIDWAIWMLAATNNTNVLKNFLQRRPLTVTLETMIEVWRESEGEIRSLIEKYFGEVLGRRLVHRGEVNTFGQSAEYVSRPLSNGIRVQGYI